MAGFGSFGNGGPSSSSSKLSPLAQPFTSDRSVLKPFSKPLIDFSDPAGTPLNSSVHNWLPSHPQNSGFDFFSNPNLEFDAAPSSNAGKYPELQAIKSPNTHLPSLNPVSMASAEPSLYSHCFDGLKTSVVEAKPYYPSYVSSSTHKDGAFVVPDQSNYDWLSKNSHVATKDGSSAEESSCSEYRSGLGGLWDGLAGLDQANQVELGGSYDLKETDLYGSSVFNNYFGGAHSSKGLHTNEEAYHTIDIQGWNKQFGLVGGQLDDKSFLGQNTKLIPSDNLRTSNSNISSIPQETHPKTPFLKYQFPYGASYEKHLRQHDAEPSEITSVAKSQPPPATRSWAETDMVIRCLSNPKEPFMFRSEEKVRSKASQFRIHEKQNNPVVIDSPLTKNEDLSNNKSVTDLHVPHLSPGFSLGHNNNVTDIGVQNSTESMDQYTAAVDSPCWKGASFTRVSPFEAPDEHMKHPLKNLEVSNSLNLSQILPYNAEDSMKISAQEPSGSTTDKGLEKNLAPSPEMTLLVNSVLGENKTDDYQRVESSRSKLGHGYGVRYPYETHEPMEGDSCSQFSHTEQQNDEENQLTSGLNISDSPEDDTDHEPFDSTEDFLCSTSFEEKLPTEKCCGEMTLKIDAQMLVNTMHNLSEMLLVHYSNGLGVWHEKDLQCLKSVISNLNKCISKSVEETACLDEFFSHQQGNSQCKKMLHPLERRIQSPLSDKNGGEDPRSTSSGHAEKNPHVLSGKKVGKTTGTDPEMDNADLIREDKMIWALKTLFCENFHDDEEPEHQALLFKNLWFEAEAALSNSNFRSRFERVKLEMEKANGVSENTSSNRQSRSAISHDLNTFSNLVAPEIEDDPTPKIPLKLDSKKFTDTTGKLALNKKHTLSTTDTNNSDLHGEVFLSTSSHTDDVIARFQIIKSQGDISEKISGVPDNTSKEDRQSSSDMSLDLNTVDKLAPESEDGPTPNATLEHSPILNTSSNADDIMARFRILKHGVDDSNFTDTAGKLAHNKKHAVTPDITNSDFPVSIPRSRENLIITSNQTDDAMARFEILKSRGHVSGNTGAEKELASFKPCSHEKTAAKLAYTDDVMAGFEILQSRGNVSDNTGSTNLEEISCFNFKPYPRDNTVEKLAHTDDVTASFKILKFQGHVSENTGAANSEGLANFKPYSSENTMKKLAPKEKAIGSFSSGKSSPKNDLASSAFARFHILKSHGDNLSSAYTQGKQLREMVNHQYFTSAGNYPPVLPQQSILGNFRKFGMNEVDKITGC